jgi:choline dehydrogenase-like flavoprotein
MRNISEMALMGNRGCILGDSGNSMITVENLERLRGIPILFISGGQSAVYSPESTLRDYEILRARFNPANYKRVVFEDRGHLDTWIGKTSNKDVYRSVEQHVRESMADRIK